MPKITVYIDANQARCINDRKQAEDLFSGTSQRASRILPHRRLQRVAFRLLRYLCGDDGRVAAWTRRWRCRWIVDMRLSGGEVHRVDEAQRPFLDRYSALRFEFKEVQRMLSSGGHNAGAI